MAERLMGKFRVEQITAIGALLVGLAALFVAWEESRIMRETQKAQALPIVISDNDINITPDEIRYTLTLSNKGVGPALIRNVKFLSDDGSEHSTVEFVDAVLEKIAQSAAIGGSDVPGYTLAPQESLNAVSLTWAETSSEIPGTLYESFANAQYVVCYCSVFGECWESRKAADPVPVKSCELKREGYSSAIMERMTRAADTAATTENEPTTND